MSEFAKKSKYMIYVNPETIEKADRIYKLDGSKSRSDFIERAIDFYAGYVTANDCLDFYPSVIISAVKGSLESFEDRIGSLMFKYAVELDMLMHIVAANFRIDDEMQKGLRGMCVRDVKMTRGNISFSDALKFQRSDE